MKKTNPESYALMPKLQHAIARLKCESDISVVVQKFRTDEILRQLATNSGEEYVSFVGSPGIQEDEEVDAHW